MESANQALPTLSENEDISPSSAESPYGGAEGATDRTSPQQAPSVVKSLTTIVKADSEITSRVADQLVDHLITRERVDVFFGLPGGAISPIDDAVRHRDDVTVIDARHEADAVFAAAGYAQETGKLGVAVVTSGPGVLNAINALACAHLEGLPVLLLAGESPRDKFARGALQDGSAYGLDLLHVARSITKKSVELTDPNAALLQLVAVIDAMKHGRRGAALITCPVDVIRARAARPKVVHPRESAPSFDADTLDGATALLAAAKRPLIFAGNGVRGGDGPSGLRAFAERLQAPVITTPHAKGVFPESHPLALGVFGLAMHPSAVRFLEGGFDCLLAVGTSFSELATSGWSTLLRPTGEHAATIQIDVDASRLGRVYPVDFAIVGPAAPVLRSIANRLAPRPKSTFGVERNSNPEVFRTGPEGKITTPRAIWELQRALPAETRFTCDSGEHTLHALHHLRVDDPRTFSSFLGLASMGSGIGAAVGQAAAAGGIPTVAIAGDGGFVMSLSAIAMAASARLPVVFAIMNDGRYSMCEVGYQTDFGRSPGFGMGPLDVARAAEGVGAKAFRIEAPEQILGIPFLVLLAEGPVVLDIAIDRQHRMHSTARHEMIQGKSPGHDLN